MKKDFFELFEKLIRKALAASWFFQISFLQKLERWYKKSRDKEKYLREEYSRLSEEKDRLYAKYGSLKKRMRGQEQDKALYLPWHTHIIFKQFNVCMSTVRWEAWTMNAKKKIEELLEASEDGTITAAQVTEAGLHRNVLQEFLILCSLQPPHN